MSREEAIEEIKYIQVASNKRINEALEMAIKALEQEPCDDAISREDALEALNAINGTAELDKAFEVIENLPPVTPSRRKGHWINDKDDMPTCSECGYIPQYDRAIDDYEYSNYCPSCGAKMESEDKE